MQDLINLIALSKKFIIVLLIAIVFDMVTGVIKAIMKKNLQSSKFREGLLKKALELIIVIMAFLCDWCFELAIVGRGTTISLILMEFWSILENIENYVPVPDFLKRFLESVKNNVDSEDFK